MDLLCLARRSSHYAGARRKWDLGHNIRRSFLYFSSLAFVSRESEAGLATHSPSSVPIESIQSKTASSLQNPKGQNWSEEFILDSENEVHAQRIRMAILKVKTGSAKDVVQSLHSDEFCSRIKLTSVLVDGLLERFGDDWKSALGFFEWANEQTGYSHTPFAYDRMVDLLGKMRQMSLMWEFVYRMHREGNVTLQTIAKVMRRLAGARRWKDVLQLFDNLESFGLFKNIDTMNLLLDTLCKERRVDAAREAYLILKHHISPNAYTFNIFVNGWCKDGKFDEAMWTLQEMRSLGFQPSVITYSTILRAYCNRLKFEKAYELLEIMTAEGCRPNIVSYTSIINSLAKSGHLDEALDIVMKMKAEGCKPDILFYNSLISILGRAGRLQEASRIFEVEMKINGVPPNHSTYNTLIFIFCHNHQVQNALNILREMESSSYKPDLQTYLPLLRLCFIERQLEGSLESLLNDMFNKHHLSLDLDTYTFLINGFCRVGNIAWAALLFDEMINREVLPRITTCTMIMHEAERRNLFPQVERIKALIEQVEDSHRYADMQLTWCKGLDL